MTSVCVFCCTQIITDNCEDEGIFCHEIIEKFFKVTQSHFRINVISIIEQEGGDFYNKACFKCEHNLKLICKLHQELESIRLKMEWKFGELISKMEQVGRTPSKVKWRRRNQPANDFQKMSNFRNDFIFKCNESLFKSTPTMVLQKGENQFKVLPAALEPIKIEVDDDDILTDDNSDDWEENQVGDENDEEMKQPLISPIINDLEDNTEPGTKSSMKTTPFKCSHCPGKYTQRKNLIRHQRSHHPHLHPKPPTKSSPIKKSFNCSHCPAKYTLRNNLMRHQRSHHPHLTATLKPPTKNHISCPQCPIKFSRRSSFLRHLRQRHPQLYQPKRKKWVPPSTNLMPSIQEIPNECLTDSKSDVKNKMKDNIPRKPNCVPCPVCQQSIKRYCLKAHFNLNHSTEDLDPQNIHRCDHPNCLGYFRTLHQLQLHIRHVHGNDNGSRTTCPICGNIFTEICNLKIHMKAVHHDESPDLPIACDVVPQCPKRFPNEAILKWHRNNYYHSEKEKPVEILNCPECQRECRGKPALKKHLKRHQRPEAPYVCELCGAAFKNTAILREHGLFHKGPDNWEFQCESCGKKCATKHRLRDHMQVHSDVKRYSCQCCGKRYNYRQNLREHVNKFHAKEGFQDIARKKAKPKLISRRTTKTKAD